MMMSLPAPPRRYLRGIRHPTDLGMSLNCQPSNNGDVMITKTNLKKKLSSGRCRVRFKKLDGLQRDMICTLSENLIPPSKRVAKSSPDPIGVVRVFDLVKKDWRSIKVENIQKFQENVTRQDELETRKLYQATEKFATELVNYLSDTKL
jgi:WYL_2, Sm-like SH3 beta-barrel fold